jgi:hypothetical protein
MKKFVLWFGVVAVIFAALAMAVPALPQNPQTQTAPLFATNAKYTNGTAPGYWPTQQAVGARPIATGLNINVGPGTANCGSGTIIQYAGGTFALTASATNRIYLDTASSCAPAVKTSAFASTDIPIAVVVTSGSAITSIVDVRTPFGVPSAGAYPPAGIIAKSNPSANGWLSSFSPTQCGAGFAPTGVDNSMNVLGCQAIGASGGYTNLVPSATTDTTVAIINGKCSTGQAYLLSTAATLTAGGTINCPVVHSAGGQWSAGSAISVTLGGGLSDLSLAAIPTKVAGTNITLVFSGSTQTHAPVEWWGAVGDGTTNNTTAIQACLTAKPVQCDILNGEYKITSALSITTSNVGIHGAVMQFNPTGSMITQATASADIIDVAGASAGSPIYNNYFDHFELKHSTAATGTAKGLSMSFTQSALIDHVTSQDSVYGFYFKNFQNSLIRDSWMLWLLSYSGPTDVYAYYVDGAAAPQSTQMRGDIAFWGGSGTIAHGFYATGSNISDIFVDRLQVSNTAYAIEVVGTNGGGFHESDIQFTNPVLNGITSACIKTSTLAFSDRGTGVSFSGGNCTVVSGATYGADIESSQGVQISGMQFTPNNGALSIYVHSSSHIILANNNITYVGATPGQIVLDGTTSSTVQGNSIWTNVAATIAAITVENTSTNNSIEGNTLDGNSLGTVTGITFDATSNANTAKTNVFKSLTTTVADTPGTNQWCDSTNCHNLGGISGMTTGQVAIAGSASTVTSSKAIQGTDTSLLSSGTVSGVGNALCLDSNGGATTAGCTGGGGGFPAPVTLTASNSASLDFTSCISSSYRDYEIRFSSLRGASNPADILLQFSSNGGASYDTTSANYQWGKHFTNVYGSSSTSGDSSNQTAAGVTLSGGGTLSTATATSSLSGRITFHDLGNSSLYKLGEGQSVGVFTTDPQAYVGDIGYQYRVTTAINAFRIIASSGNIASGSVTCQPLPQ